MFKSDPRIEALSKVPLFDGCSRVELERIAGLGDEIHFPAGAALMREGRLGHEAFVLLEGTVDIAIDGQRVATIVAGDIVGEMALIEHEPRTATATARTELRVLALTSQGFNAVLDASPTVVWRLLATLTQRLRAAQAA
jgi:CRP-like cAMP-binding protein